MTPCHVRAGPSFVEEHQPVGIEVELALEPVQPAVQDVGTVLLSGARGPFSTRDAVTIKEPPQRADPNRHGAPPAGLPTVSRTSCRALRRSSTR